MRFTDIFIKRPVLASVVSLLILLFGANSLNTIQIRQFPKMDNTVITITTSYPGADADTIAGFITSPIEQSVASAEGIDYLISSSSTGVSTITCKIKLNFNPNVAFTDIMSKVSQVQNQLPKAAMLPVINKSSDSSSALLYMSFSSDEMTSQQITDYVARVIQPQFETVDGVASADILGAKTYSMRIFLNPKKMAAYRVTPNDVYSALQNNNFQTAAGNTKGQYVQINIRANTDLSKEREFQNIIIKNNQNSVVRLKDIAKVVLGSQSYDSEVTFNGKKAVFLAISPTPTANPLTVISGVKKLIPAVVKNFPPTLKSSIVYDATQYIRASILEVIETLIEAAVIVIFVILLFLGSFRTVLIPIVTIPLSLIGVFTFMLALGYSLNLLTLLALVLAIGLVVDDAIVVVENIYRHVEEGKKPFEAALIGAREIAIPVISMTITLAAVYAPIGFMGGLTGSLFKEFAFTLASTVIISGIIALTLSPMMCSKLLSHDISEVRLVQIIDRVFDRLKKRYERLLTSILSYRPPIVLLALVVFLSLPYLYATTSKETAPQEDQGFFLVSGTAPQYSSIDYVSRFANSFNKIFQNMKATQDYFIVNSPGSTFSGIVLKPWDKRKQSQFELKGPLQNSLDTIAGLQTYAIIPPSLPGGGGGTPIEFVITSTSDFKTLYDLTEQIRKKAQKTGQFIFLANSLSFDKPVATLKINRNIASELGLDMRTIGGALSSALSGGYVNFFSLESRSYEVIPQLERRFRLTPEQLEHIYVRTKSNHMVALSTFTTISYSNQPNELSHFQQLNSATLNGIPMIGVPLGDALGVLQNIADSVLPKGFSYNYGGQSRQYIQEGNTLLFVFLLSTIVIFLVLAAQFESFRDPLTVLVSVPLSICGALIPLNLGLATINIYTQVGLITLIGLISKHGILITEFANQLQIQEGLSIKNAVIKAASVRLRPILMTTAAMVFGVVPLLLATGAGAMSRYNIGLVISSGMVIGTLFTLFVVPTMYTFFANNHHQPKQD